MKSELVGTWVVPDRIRAIEKQLRRQRLQRGVNSYVNESMGGTTVSPKMGQQPGGGIAFWG